jgi:hypothetical protein
MNGFIAGAARTGLSVASSTVVARSSALATGHAGEERGGGRGDDEQVGLAREPDVADLGLVGEREQLGVDLVAAERGQRERGHELRRGAGQHDPEREAAVAAAPDQLQALVGGDAAADDEQDALALHGAASLPQDQEPVNSPK